MRHGVSSGDARDAGGGPPAAAAAAAAMAARAPVKEAEAEVPEPAEAEFVSLEEADAETTGSKKPAADGAEGDEDVEMDESLDDAAFIEEQEEGNPDVTDIIGDARTRRRTVISCRSGRTKPRAASWSRRPGPLQSVNAPDRPS